jgi:hypothetical protein
MEKKYFHYSYQNNMISSSFSVVIPGEPHATINERTQQQKRMKEVEMWGKHCKKKGKYPESEGRDLQNVFGSLYINTSIDLKYSILANIRMSLSPA